MNEIAKLYFGQWTQEDIKQAFKKRTHEKVFWKIGEKYATNLRTKTGSIWYGYELATDSPYLGK